MSYVTGAIKLIFFLIALPFCTGLVFVPRAKSLKRTFHIVYIYGWLFNMAVFFTVSVACIFFIEQNNFMYCVITYAVLQILLAVAGVAVYAGRRLRHDTKGGGDGATSSSKTKVSAGSGSGSHIEFNPPGTGKTFDVIQGFSSLLKERGRRNFLEAVILWAVFGGLLAFQLYKAVTTVFFDGDNIYYVVQSLIAAQQGTMYREIPYIGGSTELDMRHALAVMPMWFAYLSEVSGIHATALCRTVMPLFLLPFVYLIWFAVGGEIYGVMSSHDDYSRPAAERAADVGLFMCALSMLAIFGSVSIYTAERFLMTRTWQGKAMFANIAVPLILLGVLWINRASNTVRNKRADEKLSLLNRFFYNGWFLFLLVNILSGMCTSMGAAFAAALICASCSVSAIRKRDLRIMLLGMLVCIPNALYMAAYILLK